MLIHAQMAAFGPAAGIADAVLVEDLLHGAVLTVRAVERHIDDIRRLADLDHVETDAIRPAQGPGSGDGVEVGFHLRDGGGGQGLRIGEELLHGDVQLRHAEEQVQKDGLMTGLQKRVAGHGAAGEGHGPFGGQPTG